MAAVQVSKVDAAPAPLSGIALYSRFALAGAVCCSLTHGGLTPVDVYVFPATGFFSPSIVVVAAWIPPGLDTAWSEYPQAWILSAPETVRPPLRNLDHAKGRSLNLTEQC